MVSWPPKRGHAPLRHHRGEDLGVGGPQQQGGVLEEVAHADGGDEHRQDGGRPEGLVGQPLDDDTQDGTHHDGQQDPHNGGQFKAGGGIEADVRAHHDDVAVGEVQHLGDAVDHGVAQCDDGVDAPQADPADEKTQKGHIGYLISSSVAKVPGNPGQCGSEKVRPAAPFRPALQ